MFERLDYRDSTGALDFTLVAPPSLSQHRFVEALYREMLIHLNDVPLGDRVDDVLSVALRLEYRKIAAILFPNVSVTALLPGSRHAFFHAQSGSLSGIQRLLAYSLPSGNVPVSDAIVISTGDVVLDCCVDLALSPLGALLPYWADRYGVHDVLLALGQTAKRQSGQQAVDEQQRKEDQSLWDSQLKDSVMAENPHLNPAAVMGLLETPPDL